MEMWAPLLIQRAGDALRATLVAGASETEDEDYYEEGSNEMIRRKERTKGTVRHKDEEFVYRGTHWCGLLKNCFYSVHFIIRKLY